MTVPTWPGAPHQWDLHQRDLHRPDRPDRTGADVAPLDPRVPALLLGLVLLVALLVVPLGGPAAAPDAPASGAVVAE